MNKEDVKHGNIVRFNGKLYVAIGFDSCGWYFSPAVKAGNRPDWRKEPQRLSMDRCELVGQYDGPIK